MIDNGFLMRFRIRCELVMIQFSNGFLSKINMDNDLVLLIMKLR